MCYIYRGFASKVYCQFLYYTFNGLDCKVHNMLCAWYIICFVLDFTVESIDENVCTLYSKKNVSFVWCLSLHMFIVYVKWYGQR